MSQLRQVINNLCICNPMVVQAQVKPLQIKRTALGNPTDVTFKGKERPNPWGYFDEHCSLRQRCHEYC